MGNEGGLKKKVEELTERIEELEAEKDSNPDHKSQKASEKISRREFLKKSVLGLGGLAALTSPVSADYFIKDDSFSVVTSPDGGTTLNENFSVEQNGDIDFYGNNLLNVNQINGQDADAIGGSGVPSGAIIMWSGSISNIPGGWTLCDGSDGAPDLQNRFVVGAGGQYTVGNTGGEKQVQLTVEEIPSHSHTHLRAPGGYYGDEPGGANSDSSSTTTDTTEPTGGDQAHENRPPYYALAYIMKL